MTAEIISGLLAIICVLAFLANGILCAKANDSRFLSMAQTPTGTFIHIVWIIAAILSAIGFLIGRVNPLTFQIVIIGGLILQLLVEIYRKLVRIILRNTETDPNK